MKKVKSPEPELSEPAETLLVNVRQVATMLRVSTRTVYRRVSSGMMVPPVRTGRCTRWSFEKLKQWVDNGCPALDSAHQRQGA